MLNKIIIAIGSAMTIALISFGIYSARELVARTPIAYWHLEEAFNSFDYADTYTLLIVGVGVGVCLMAVLNGFMKSLLANDYNDLVDEHNKLIDEKDELRLDAIRNFGKSEYENKELKKELERVSDYDDLVKERDNCYREYRKLEKELKRLESEKG